MTGFITSISELIALIFNSFRLPSLLPALVFATANGLIVFPSLKDTAVGQAYFSANDAGQTLILILITALTAYLLNALNLTIIRWFEGYPLLEMRFPISDKFQDLYKNHFLDLQDKRRELEEEMIDIRYQEMRADPTTSRYLHLQRELHDVNEELALFYPSKVDLVAPTRLANVIASAEDHSYALYRMDSVALWALLVPILTKEGYSKFVEQEKAPLDFLLNTLIVVALLGFEIIFIGWFYRNATLGFIIGETIAICIACWLLYSLSITSAMGWGQTIRTAFDLYRHKLRKELKIKEYDDFGAERNIWRRVSAFYRDRNTGFGQEIFSYPSEKDG